MLTPRHRKLLSNSWSYFKEMALRLANAGFKIIVLSPRAKVSKRKENVENIIVYYCSCIICFPQIPLVIVNPFNFISTLKIIMQEHKRLDLIYDTTSSGLPLALITKFFIKLKRREKIPLIIHVHGELKELKSKKILSFFFELYLHIVSRLSFAMADKILLAGERIAPRVLGLGANPDKLKVVRLGLKYEDELHHINVLSKEEKMELRTSLGLYEEDFVVGYVGRLSLGKGLDTLLNAVTIVKKAIPRLKVLLVGDGGERARLSMLASKLGIGNITLFVGHRDDVLDLLQLMDVFINLSESEAGISASQLEAMRMGLPSIITPFTDILDDKKHGIIVPFKAPQAVADAILLLYRNETLRRILGVNSSIKAQELLKLYTWKRYVDGVTKVFRDVMKACVRKTAQDHLKC